jgi:hypothetical protein
VLAQLPSVETDRANRPPPHSPRGAAQTRGCATAGRALASSFLMLDFCISLSAQTLLVSRSVPFHTVEYDPEPSFWSWSSRLIWYPLSIDEFTCAQPLSTITCCPGEPQTQRPRSIQEHAQRAGGRRSLCTAYLRRTETHSSRSTWDAAKRWNWRFSWPCRPSSSMQ